MNIVKQGRRIEIYGEEISFPEKLRVIPHTLDIDIKGNCGLVEGNEFSLPEKLYDIEKPFREAVLKSFNSLNKNMGVLLIGEKGMGKTVVAKLLAIESGLPIIMINRSIPIKSDFARYISEIDCDLVVLIDEFEKIVPTHSDPLAELFHNQEAFLGLMDGVISSNYKRLFILTSNDKIDDRFMDRPTRIRYCREYEFMNEKVYDMIIQDKLINKSYEEDLRKNLTSYEANVDLLCTVIEEINIQDKAYGDFKEFFNHKPKWIKYSKWRKDETGKWTWIDDFELREKINLDTRWIQGITGQVTVKEIREDGIYMETIESVLKSKSLDPDEDESYENKKVYYKLKEEKYYRTMTSKVL